MLFHVNPSRGIDCVTVDGNAVLGVHPSCIHSNMKPVFHVKKLRKQRGRKATYKTHVS